MNKAVGGKAPGFSRMSPYLPVSDVDVAVCFYEEAFGFLPGARYSGKDGTLVYADLHYEGATLLVGLPGRGPFAPAAIAQGGGTVYCYTPDVSALAQRAVRAGAQLLCSVEHTSWKDRLCIMTDPFGHRWMWATHEETPRDNE